MVIVIFIVIVMIMIMAVLFLSWATPSHVKHTMWLMSAAAQNAVVQKNIIDSPLSFLP